MVLRGHFQQCLSDPMILELKLGLLHAKHKLLPFEASLWS